MEVGREGFRVSGFICYIFEKVGICWRDLMKIDYIKWLWYLDGKLYFKFFDFFEYNNFMEFN